MKLESTEGPPGLCGSTSKQQFPRFLQPQLCVQQDLWPQEAWPWFPHWPAELAEVPSTGASLDRVCTIIVQVLRNKRHEERPSLWGMKLVGKQRGPYREGPRTRDMMIWGEAQFSRPYRVMEPQCVYDLWALLLTGSEGMTINIHLESAVNVQFEIGIFMTSSH